MEKLNNTGGLFGGRLTPEQHKKANKIKSRVLEYFGLEVPSRCHFAEVMNCVTGCLSKNEIYGYSLHNRLERVNPEIMSNIKSMLADLSTPTDSRATTKKSRSAAQQLMLLDRPTNGAHAANNLSATC